jgi:protein-S-isoprenylcysteine O-methyltransferase Ste14
MEKNFALLILMAWPVIPIFWIPVHFAARFFRRIGILTYFLPAIFWLPVALIIYHNRETLLAGQLTFPPAVRIAGVLLLAGGTLLHLWTAHLLGLKGISGVFEVSDKNEGRIVTQGPFSVVRHPTYTAHTLLFVGGFLATEYAAVGIVALLDLVIVLGLLMPLEEKELLTRFGEAYSDYKRHVKWKFFPGIL